MAGQITLRMIAEHVTHLDVECSRCARTGRLNIESLIRQHGARLPISTVLAGFTTDCPKRNGSTYEACDPNAPELRQWFGPRGNGNLK